MKVIRQRIWFLSFSTVFSFGICILIFICHFRTLKIPIQLLLATAFLVSGLLAGLWVHAHIRLTTGQLIIDNQILHIRPAEIHPICNNLNAEPVGGIEVFISNFGILLDSKIIKFNQGGCQLKDVEIGRDFISLVYGSDKRKEKTWLLRTPTDDLGLSSIVERFRYETGVVPVIRD